MKGVWRMIAVPHFDIAIKAMRCVIECCMNINIYLLLPISCILCIAMGSNKNQTKQ